MHYVVKNIENGKAVWMSFTFTGAGMTHRWTSNQNLAYRFAVHATAQAHADSCGGIVDFIRHNHNS